MVSSLNVCILDVSVDSRFPWVSLKDSPSVISIPSFAYTELPLCLISNIHHLLTSLLWSVTAHKPCTFFFFFENWLGPLAPMVIFNVIRKMLISYNVKLVAFSVASSQFVVLPLLKPLKFPSAVRLWDPLCFLLWKTKFYTRNCHRLGFIAFQKAGT